MKRILLAAAAVAVLLVAGAAWWVWGELSRPFAGFDGELFLQIEHGTDSRELASLFERRGVVLVRALLALDVSWQKPAERWETELTRVADDASERV